MSNPALPLATPPFRLTRHKPTISRHTLDTIIDSSFTQSRPSSASTTSSFTTAFSSLEAGSPFRYYLPHISTSTSPFYTKSEAHACNLVPCTPGVRSEQAGRFYHYVPRGSTEERAVYGEAIERGTRVQSRTALQRDAAGEQKVPGAPKQLVSSDPLASGLGGATIPLENTAGADLACRSGDDEENGTVDNGSYTAGETLDTCASTPGIVGGEARKQRRKLTKGQHRKPETVAEMSKKVRRMLKKLRLGRKAA